MQTGVRSHNLKMFRYRFFIRLHQRCPSLLMNVSHTSQVAAKMPLFDKDIQHVLVQGGWRATGDRQGGFKYPRQGLGHYVHSSGRYPIQKKSFPWQTDLQLAYSDSKQLAIVANPIESVV